MTLMIRSERLNLIPASLDLCRAEVVGHRALGCSLQARVPLSWPPPVLEADDLQRIKRKLEADPAAAQWTLCYLILEPAAGRAERQLVGVAGFADPPTADGTVEIGYAIAEEHQRRGYATEAVRALVAHAFADPRVVAIRATTYPTLRPSIGVLEKTGFELRESSAASGLLLFEHRRRPLQSHKKPAPGPPPR